MIIEEKETLEKQRELFMEEKRVFEEVIQKISSVHSPSPIQLNIGGKKFCTTLDTLTQYRDSFFGAMFSGHIALKPEKDGTYFIDRDGKNFHYILNYLRTGELIVPQNKPHLLKMLLLEAEFYQISTLIDILGGDAGAKTESTKQGEELFVSSSILIADQPLYSVYCEKLNEWSNSTPSQKWEMIYKGSKDGFESSGFHSQCDNKGATYTIVKSGKSIFGGYHPNSWSSKGGYSFGNGSFLFSLVNIYNIPPLKLANKNNNIPNGPFDRNDYLPTFGRGFDMHISNNCNSNFNSYSNFFSQGSSYLNPTNKNLLTGSEYFKVDEIEVFIKL